MVFVDLEKELNRIKREEKQAEKQSQNETEKQMRYVWDTDDAAIRTKLALERLKTARYMRQYAIRRRVLTEPKLENIIIR